MGGGATAAVTAEGVATAFASKLFSEPPRMYKNPVLRLKPAFPAIAYAKRNFVFRNVNRDGEKQELAWSQRAENGVSKISISNISRELACPSPPSDVRALCARVLRRK